MQKEIQHFTKDNLLTKLFNFYIFSNIHVAFAAFCLVKITLLNIGVSENKIAWFVFFSTLLSYNIIRLLRLSSITNWHQLWIVSNKNALYFLVLSSAFIILYLSFTLRLKAILILIPFSIATLFYAIPFKKYSLRNLPGFKIFLIAVSWAGITVLFPLVQNYITLRVVDYITFFQRILFVIVITLPFDIRDLDFDSDSLKTIPQSIGINKTKIFGALLLIILFIVGFLKPTEEHAIWTTFIITMFTGFILYKTTKKQSKYHSAFFVESLPILWYLLISVCAKTL